MDTNVSALKNNAFAILKACEFILSPLGRMLIIIG